MWYNIRIIKYTLLHMYEVPYIRQYAFHGLLHGLNPTEWQKNNSI